MYLAKAVHTITFIRDIGILYNTNAPNHLPYNSVHTACCVPPQRKLTRANLCVSDISTTNRHVMFYGISYDP